MTNEERNQVIQTCQDIAKMVASKNRTEFGVPVGHQVPGQPPSPVLSLHDAWVVCAKVIQDEMEKLKT